MWTAVPTVGGTLAGQRLGIAASEDLFHSHAEEMYAKLERDIIPLYYNQRERWIGVMRSAVSINGAHFTTERMLRDYLMKEYDD